MLQGSSVYVGQRSVQREAAADAGVVVRGMELQDLGDLRPTTVNRKPSQATAEAHKVRPSLFVSAEVVK